MTKPVCSSSFLSLGAIVGTALFVSACTSQFATRGNLPDPIRVEEVIPGEVSARDVAEILGTPSTFSTFGGESWYYISERVEYYAFLEPEILERNVLRVTFDDKGIVAAVDQKDDYSSRDIEFVERVTPTAGNELSFFGQIFGNLGRFNRDNQ